MIELHGRITEAGILEVTLPKGLPPGDVIIHIESTTPDDRLTEAELQAIQDNAPNTFQELVEWLKTAPATENWGGLSDTDDPAEYIHNIRHTPTAWLNDPEQNSK